MSIIFFDIDGTIVDRSEWTPPSTISAIKQLQSQGHFCIINTGRPYIDLGDTVLALGFDGFVCTCGQHIVFRHAVIFHDGFDPKTSQILRSIGLRCNMDLYYESEEGVWVDAKHAISPELQMSLDRFIRRGIKIETPDMVPNFQFDKFSISYTEDSLLQEFLEAVQPYCECIDRGENMYELPKRGYTKGTGCSIIANALGVPLQDCYAIGDSTNDIPMLTCVGHPLVMGSAPESVKQYAEYVTDALPQDGLAKALKHLGLIASY